MTVVLSAVVQSRLQTRKAPAVSPSASPVPSASAWGTGQPAAPQPSPSATGTPTSSPAVPSATAPPSPPPATTAAEGGRTPRPFTSPGFISEPLDGLPTGGVSTPPAHGATPTPSLPTPGAITATRPVTAAPPATFASWGGLPYFGVSLARINPEQGLAQAVEAGVQVARHGIVRWKDVEPVRTEPPTYIWETAWDLEQDIISARQAGIELTVLVLFTPPWAQQVAGYSCGSIREDALDEFAQFLRAMVKRYRVPPYKVKYWELFNEPDVDPSAVAPDNGYGCWGDQNDPQYGGKTYARMLQVAYPAIKAADPQARVIFGGLLLDGPDKASAKFLSGVLAAGGGDFFDVLAFHAYTYFYPGYYSMDIEPAAPWGDRGGVILGKTAFIRQVLERYGYRKPLYLNEAGYGWAAADEPPAGYRKAQADYVAKLYARGLALDLDSVVWYGWRGPGWRQMALLHNDLTPTLGAQAFAFSVEQLDKASYIGPAGYAGLEGYAFRSGADRVEVVWSADGLEHPVTVPAKALRGAFDSSGKPIPHQKSGDRAAFQVLAPIYIRVAP